MNCNTAPTCTVGWTQTTSYTVGWTVSISGAGSITGGFEVQNTISSGTNYECQSTRGHTVCNWYKFTHTAFTVQDYWFYPCYPRRGENSGSPYIVFAPNK